MRREKISVLGAGAWGTALADLLARNGHDVLLWAHERQVVETINRRHVNPLYLAGYRLSSRVLATHSLRELSAWSPTVFSVVPTVVLRNVLERLRPFVTDHHRFVSASKGIEEGHHALCHQVFRDTLGVGPNRYAALSGPSFAGEVVVGEPTAITVASRNRAFARHIRSLLFSPSLAVYVSDDVVGTEFAGALKNVIAIAIGLAAGVGYGRNTQAAILTRGLAEMRRLGVWLGARPETFLGLAGVGDLVLTATGEASRNRQLGLKLGRGVALTKLLRAKRSVAEGVETSASVYALSLKHNVAMPICREVYLVLFRRKQPGRALHDLLKQEFHLEAD